MFTYMPSLLRLPPTPAIPCQGINNTERDRGESLSFSQGLVSRILGAEPSTLQRVTHNLGPLFPLKGQASYRQPRIHGRQGL